MWGGAAGLAFAALVAWAFVQWRLRARILRRVEAHACALCGHGFDDAIAEWVGPVGRAQRARLDAFQRRFAAYLVRCGDCGCVNVCTHEGQPFAAWPEDR